MFITPQTIKAETAYRQERTKREFRKLSRRTRPEQAAKPAPRHARRRSFTTAA
ncbi:hypothetical protein GCM10029976_071230 [Kribbella albertanoniae]|uniref:hypothetical protein n=1 Tax=Kribbella albertanoniae TaxID=1266829 RepID=UPI001404A2E9|nr:hypothetical protein [Kribbella albertanoniae]